MALRLPATLADHRPATGPAALVGPRVFDGTGAPVGGPVTVLLRDGRIERVQDAAEPVPAGIPQVDLSGRYLMPGLVDVHAHLSILEHVDRFPRPEHGAEPLLPNLAGHVVAQTLRRCLRMGVTTVRDVGAYGDVVLEARQAMRYGVLADLGCTLRADRLGHRTGRPVLRRHVPRGRRSGRPAPRGPGAVPSRRRPDQAHDHRGPVGRDRGPRPGTADPARGRGRRRRGAPSRSPGGRALRGPGRFRARDPRRCRQHRARDVPAPPSGSAWPPWPSPRPGHSSRR